MRAAVAVSLVAVAGPAAVAAPAPVSPGVAAGTDHAASYDSRSGGTAVEKDLLARQRVAVQTSAAVSSTRAALGGQGLVDIDALTGTPRVVARLDGFLTGPSTAGAAAVARSYLNAHADVFRLTPAEVAGLVLSRDYADISGTHHLSFTQRAGGLTLFGNGVKADVRSSGELIQVTGSPVPALAAPASLAAPRIASADAAIRVAKTDTAEAVTAPAKGDTAEQVLFRTPGSTRRAWRTVTMSAATPTLDVVDAQTGRVLYRDPLADEYTAPDAPAAPAAAAPEQYANVVDNWPGAPAGGNQHPVSLNQNGWLPRGSVVLFGNNSHTYADVNDNNQADQTEEISATGNQGYRFPLTKFAVGGQPCSASYPCTWNPDIAGSWKANLARTATQNFYFINKFHDHLQAAPIGFTAAAGNFQQVNAGGAGVGGDPVLDQPLDGADTADGLPDGTHIDNANFATPPDGTSPTMQMYLWHQPGTAYPAEDPFISVSGSDDADIVYHEYTHGLSHRLVVDADNVPALDSIQGGSMGEAWSDWYALDYLVNDGYFTDTAAPGEIEVGKYVIAGADDFRSEPTDCPVGRGSTLCPGTPAAGPGGYTYGDFGKIAASGPEVHADGEIWAQTLWDLRTALGSKVAESVVTRGMELSPTLPSMLDMRNAILLADRNVYDGSHQKALWKAFAARGMGFFAGTVTGDDVKPVENFSVPPTSGATGGLTGVVTDANTHQPVRNVRVAFGGHDSGLPGASYQAVTNAQGVYSITGVVAGTYPDVYAVGAGYDLSVAPPTKIGAGVARRDFALLRDWAAASGGGSIAKFTGVDYSDFGCGPGGDIDQSGGTGWGSTSDLSAAGAPTAATPKYIVIALPKAVDVSGISVNPSNTCGDGASAATGDYRLQVSTDGTTFTTAATGRFTTDDLGKLVPITLSGTTTGIVAVKFWMLTPQAVTRGLACPSSGASGCQFMDSSEVEVFGSAAA